jgi:hypothetical protein
LTPEWIGVLSATDRWHCAQFCAEQIMRVSYYLITVFPR